MRLTYLGHATVMIELDGVRILTDPILGRRLGPLRRHGPTPDPASFGAVDAVLISHGHPDHFHGASLRAIPGDPVLVVPRGLGTDASRGGREIREVAANDRVDVGPVRVTAVPARHERWPRQRSARPLGFLIEGSMRVYFAGDTALYPGMDASVDCSWLWAARNWRYGPSRVSTKMARYRNR